MASERGHTAHCSTEAANNATSQFRPPLHRQTGKGARDTVANLLHTSCADSALIPHIKERTRNSVPGDVRSITQSVSAQINEQFCGGSFLQPSRSSDV
jgi:hypothetical protein